MKEIKMTEQATVHDAQSRMLSVDVFRGFTMFMLVSGIGQLFREDSNNNIVSFIGKQMEHANWEGLTAWDLVQPFFMFIVGVSMPFSFSRKIAKGESWNKSFQGVVRRSLLLLFLGWVISSETKSSFANVLAQLSVTYFIAFLVMRKPMIWQIIFSAGLIVFTDVIYRLWSVPGFNQPFAADHNFGSWVDVMMTGGVNEDRWVAFNAVPTTAHTIWGVLTGIVLMKEWTLQKKFRTLFTTGIILIIAGYILGIYIPIIKRTCTSSFIIVSGGWAITCLAITYFFIDILSFRKGVMFFAIVGMNPLFIYLFWHTGGTQLLENFVLPVTTRTIGAAGPGALHVANVLTVACMLWYICYFLYKRKIFIKI
ncbi:MAG: DUF5009 domain-containing protein [Agriterribacter sp.]